MVGQDQYPTVGRYRKPPNIARGISDPPGGETRATSTNVVEDKTWNTVGPQELH